MWNYASPDRYELLKEFALENRNHPTEAELIFWEMVRGKRTGFKFFRQHIIGDYIVDFFCPTPGIVVEVDGGYHMERTQQEDDQIRTDWLESIGLHVIRFTNEEVILDIENTRNKLIAFIEQY